MRHSRLGSVLLGLGLLVGIVAGIALLVGFQPSRLPAAWLDLAAYKLTFVAALGLIAVGAAVSRAARGQPAADVTHRTASPPLVAPPNVGAHVPPQRAADPDHR